MKQGLTDDERRFISLSKARPGWLQHAFGIDEAWLVACNASPEAGWSRSEPFSFLYRSKRGIWYVLETEKQWRTLDGGEAHRLCEALPVRRPNGDETRVP